MVALRTVLGQELRQHRVAQRRTLREVAAKAQVSIGYLSEIERGHKEASSELLVAICQALNLPLSGLFTAIASEYAAVEAELAKAQGVTPLRTATAAPEAKAKPVPVAAPASAPNRNAA